MKQLSRGAIRTMILANQLTAGMTIILSKKPYKVDSVVKVTLQKANPIIKVKLEQLETHEIVEKNFRPTQELEDVSLEEHRLEFLYVEDRNFVFLDIGTLDLHKVREDILGRQTRYLKEGVDVKAICYGKTILAIDIPQFLELMVSSIEIKEDKKRGSLRIAILETGAQLEVPPFVEAGDVLKVDTSTDEYVQRV
jgi:elongation factor P